ncbi:30S ribosomal protein S12 methylthiotransferase RimO [Desulfonatronovibrio magnus]|uniref:30S ribosomal protein S12 methylthiotransferase RimO n=1 Tax=Desulfonatronovibrio magnus TaxID=698827 RepID=UPI0005EB2D61|nr:30S ribosomal protein S12 methylthiotransferase RimO [Desulfonatronovibrio magnus]
MSRVRVFTRSLGCPKNLVDTENILGGLGKSYEPAPDIQNCDVVLINTCAFIQPAVEESLEVIFAAHEERRRLEKSPLLVVTGCLPSRYGNSLEMELPEADLLAPISRQKNLPQDILAALNAKPASSACQRRISTPNSYAYLKISEGCNNKCFFCTIPSIRGRLKSRNADDILTEAQWLISSGIKEIIVVAQDSTAWGRDSAETSDAAGLIAELSGLKGLQRLRLMYLYPTGLSHTFLEFMARTGPPLLPYFDVPFQHSHPDILKSMGRPFRQDPMEVVKKIRQVLPGAVLRTTLITGYPGEKEEHFAHLCDFVKNVGFNHLGVFPFHAEEGTRAAEMPEQVPEEQKVRRAEMIMSMQKNISREKLAKYQDKEVEVLVDIPHPEWPGLFMGRTWFQAPEIDGITYVSGPDVEPGAIVRARVQETKDYDLVAMQD